MVHGWWMGLWLLGGCDGFLGDLLTKRPNRYKEIYGFESFDYAYTTEAGIENCHLVWAVTGQSRSIPDNCVGCTFVFDVELLYDAGPYEGESHYTDTTCSSLAQDIGGYTYAYSRRYDALLVSYDDVYYLQWLEASWEVDEDRQGGRLTYGGGVRDSALSALGDPYVGYYYTYYWYGSIHVQK